MSVGIHISKHSNIILKDDKHTKYKSYMEAIKNEVELLNMSAFAVFTIQPRSKAKISMDHQSIKKYTEENNIKVYSHTSYISTGIWSVNFKNRPENKSLMYLRLIKDELVQAKQLGALGVVLHVPRRTISEVLETMEILSNCKVINSIRRNPGILPKLTLEFPSSKPGTELTYETPEKLNAFVKALKDDDKINLEWNLALDTAHLFAGGVSFKESNSWHEYVEALTPMTKSLIKLFHMNGALGKNFGTGADCHIIPFSKNQDAIWGHLLSDEMHDFVERTSFEEINKINLYEKLSLDELKVLKNSSLYDIVKFAKKCDIAMIMEINRGDYNTAKCAMDIINGLLKDAPSNGGSDISLQISELKI